MNEAHHWGWIAVVIIIIGVVTYIWTTSRPNIEQYAKGSSHQDVAFHSAPFSINFGCVPIKPDVPTIPAKVKK